MEVLNYGYIVDKFKEAKQKNAKGICVVIENKEMKNTESIIFNKEDFDYKLNYYLNAYDKDLYHKYNKNIRIVKIVPFIIEVLIIKD